VTPHPSHPGWYHPPIPAAPRVCQECGAWSESEEGAEPCPGEPRHTEPPDTESGATIQAAAWHEHQETHR
jgi:hypothetical protein